MDWTTGPLELLHAHVGPFGARCSGALLCLPVLVLGFRLVERRWPLARQGEDWNATDLKYFLFNPCFDLLSRVSAACCMIACAWFAGARAPAGLLRGFGPVMLQPKWLILAEMLLLLELIAYSSHRLFHSVPWLWRFHAIHHSTTRLNWLSAVRRHPLNDLVTHCLNTTVLFCIGFPLERAMQLFPLIAMHALFTHSNVDMRFGPLGGLIVSPVYHRFHHTHNGEAGNKNFAALFPIFDKLFGTYHLPENDPLSVGIEGAEIPESFFQQLLHPFRRSTERA